MKCPKCKRLATRKHFQNFPVCDAYVRSLCAIRSISKRNYKTKLKTEEKTK